MSKTLSKTIEGQAGMALIIALVLLMVLTMIAVVGMRTTTLDLRMTSNQTLIKRVFQSSESARLSIYDVLDDHTFYRGWPSDQVTNGTVPPSAGFTTIPSELNILVDPTDPNSELYLTENATTYQLDSGFADMRFLVDSDGGTDYDDPGDMVADIFITRLATIAAPGSDTSQVSGYEGLGAGAASAGSLLFYNVVSRAAGPGGTQSTTSAHYRYVITN